jgi:hypothetical protein
MLIEVRIYPIVVGQRTGQKTCLFACPYQVELSDDMKVDDRSTTSYVDSDLRWFIRNENKVFKSVGRVIYSEPVIWWEKHPLNTVLKLNSKIESLADIRLLRVRI